MQRSIRQLQADRKELWKKIHNDECGAMGKISPLRKELHEVDLAICCRIYAIIDRVMKSMDRKIGNAGMSDEYFEARRASRIYFRHGVIPACERKYGKVF
jgi:hypothetical protein